MDKKKIKYLIDEEGNVTLEPVGIEGRECLEVTKSYEEEISGGSIVKRSLKKEYYTSPVQQQQKKEVTRGKN